VGIHDASVKDFTARKLDNFMNAGLLPGVGVRGLGSLWGEGLRRFDGSPYV